MPQHWQMAALQTRINIILSTAFIRTLCTAAVLQCCAGRCHSRLRGVLVRKGACIHLGSAGQPCRVGGAARTSVCHLDGAIRQFCEFISWQGKLRGACHRRCHARVICGLCCCSSRRCRSTASGSDSRTRICRALLTGLHPHTTPLAKRAYTAADKHCTASCWPFRQV